MARYLFDPGGRRVVIAPDGPPAIDFDSPVVTVRDDDGDHLAAVVAEATLDAAAARLGTAVLGRRELAATCAPREVHRVHRAFHLARWAHRTQFCGACGAPTVWIDGETARVCRECGESFYPQIAPAVIVAVTSGDRLLLAHGSRHPEGMMSVLAGFMEPGETIEATVTREIEEEAGIRVTNVTYFSSQPWAFPDSLMIACTAESAGGELVPEEGEIEDLGWYGPHELPSVLPGFHSIARRLIEWFVVTYGSDADVAAYYERSS